MTNTTEREQIVARSMALGQFWYRHNSDGSMELIDPLEIYAWKMTDQEIADHLKESPHG